RPAAFVRRPNALRSGLSKPQFPYQRPQSAFLKCADEGLSICGIASARLLFLARNTRAALNDRAMTLQVAEPAILERAAPALVDPFARAITYLRVSVTDRCDFRCVYCMAENMTFLPRADVLSIE